MAKVFILSNFRISQDIYNESVFSIPSVVLPNPELAVFPEFPAYAHTDEPFTIIYRVWNRTRSTEDCLAQLETDGSAATSSADTIGFVYSGYKQLRFRVPPLCEFHIKYNLYPVKGGRCKMPRLKIERKKAVGSPIIHVTGKEVWVDGEELLGENVGFLFVKPKQTFDE